MNSKFCQDKIQRAQACTIPCPSSGMYYPGVRAQACTIPVSELRHVLSRCPSSGMYYPGVRAQACTIPVSELRHVLSRCPVTWSTHDCTWNAIGECLYMLDTVNSMSYVLQHRSSKLRFGRSMVAVFRVCGVYSVHGVWSVQCTWCVECTVCMVCRVYSVHGV